MDLNKNYCSKIKIVNLRLVSSTIRKEQINHPIYPFFNKRIRTSAYDYLDTSRKFDKDYFNYQPRDVINHSQKIHTRKKFSTRLNGSEKHRIFIEKIFDNNETTKLIR